MIATPEMRRVLADSQVAETRPIGVSIAAWVSLGMGLVGAYTLFRALVPLPHRAFPVSKPMAILSCCAMALVVGAVIAAGLRAGRLWSWLGGAHWALIAGGPPAAMLADRTAAGLTLGTAIALSPRHAALVGLSAALLVLLMTRGVRSWFGRAHRLRSMPLEEWDRDLVASCLARSNPAER
jgi:hypothetical protein